MAQPLIGNWEGVTVSVLGLFRGWLTSWKVIDVILQDFQIKSGVVKPFLSGRDGEEV